VIIVENPVVTDDRHILGLSLRDQHAVERVLVRSGEQTCPLAVFNKDGKFAKARPLNSGGKFRCEHLRARQLADPHL